MRRGEIRWVSLDPVLGSEAAKRRPAVIVSNDRANASASRLGRGVLTVVPLATSTDRVYPFQTLIPADESGLEEDSKAQAEQVRSVALERIGASIGHLSPSRLQALDAALRLHLDL